MDEVDKFTQLLHRYRVARECQPAESELSQQLVCDPERVDSFSDEQTG